MQKSKKPALVKASVAALGAPPLAVLIFEVALNATSMFNHSSIRLPKKIDRLLRLIVVTPDMIFGIQRSFLCCAC